MLWFIARGSLWLLLAPATLLAIGTLGVGLWAAPVLFRWDRPFALAVWGAQIVYPAFLAFALLSTRRKWSGYTVAEDHNGGASRRLFIYAIAAWAFVGLLAVMWWLAPFGSVWGW